MEDSAVFEMVGKYTKAKIMIDNVDETTLSQIVSFLNNPAFTNPVAIMPDCHAGKGAVIGFTMPLTTKLVPNVVGVDIGCGVYARKLPIRDIKNLEQLDISIRAKVPFGYEIHENPIINMEKDFPWEEVRKIARTFWSKFNKTFSTNVEPISYDYDWFISKCEIIGIDAGRAVNSLGTVGGGNHFIEVGRDSTGSLWLTIHSGSRNFGKKICEYWQGTPIRKMNEKKQEKFKAGLEEIKRTHTTKAQRKLIPEAIKQLRAYLEMDNKVAKGLEYLEGEDAYGYLHDMIFTTVYAKENRRLIGKIVSENVMGLHDPQPYEIESVHNYIDFSDFIIRKGAISAYTKFILIPLNMEDGTLICKGLANQEWNYSAPHGAGRMLSRNKAKELVDVEKAAERMRAAGIFASSIPADETKNAYKDSNIIKEAIAPTAEIVDVIKPIINLKD